MDQDSRPPLTTFEALAGMIDHAMLSPHLTEDDVRSGCETAARYQVAITADAMKPGACAGITLATVVAGITGTGGADLLLGSAAANSMTGSGGNDCILGGGGNDSIDYGTGIDVAIGGPGTDTFNSNCETQIQ